MLTAADSVDDSVISSRCKALESQRAKQSESRGNVGAVIERDEHLKPLTTHSSLNWRTVRKTPSHFIAGVPLFLSKKSLALALPERTHILKSHFKFIKLYSGHPCQSFFQYIHTHNLLRFSSALRLRQIFGVRQRRNEETHTRMELVVWCSYGGKHARRGRACEDFLRQL